jgi:hypothetical protein
VRVTLPYDAALVNTVVPVTLERVNGDGHVNGTVDHVQLDVPLLT